MRVVNKYTKEEAEVEEFSPPFSIPKGLIPIKNTIGKMLLKMKDGETRIINSGDWIITQDGESRKITLKVLELYYQEIQDSILEIDITPFQV
jgi:hypothetical protein